MKTKKEWTIRNKLNWIKGQLIWLFIRVIHKITGKYVINTRKYGRYKLNKSIDVNKYIYEHIKTNKPFAFCRFSFVELDLLIRCRTEDYFGIKTYQSKKDCINMFKVEGQKNNYGIRKFNHLMLEAISNADILGVWPNLPMGDVFLNTLQNIDDKILGDAIGVEPYAFDEPWSKALEGKKVLVVSPFSDEITMQYERRTLLWENKSILPDFELQTMDSVWFFFNQKDERFADWFAALDFLYNEIMRHDFDIVLLGCGAFGFPLAAKVKTSGRQAIHMGGAIQILFGIKGKRWDDTIIGNFYNEYWIRPKEKSKPVNSPKLDNNCYW